MTDIPHFRIPFEFVTDGRGIAAAETEQGSGDEIFDCVQAIVRTQKGVRIENPEFGVEDQTFSTDINIVRLQEDVLRWEPRANVVFESRIDEVDRLVRIVSNQAHVGKTATGSES